MRVLIVRTGAMGDVLHALAGVTGLRRLRPDWRIDWVVDPRWATLLMDGEGRAPAVTSVHLAKTAAWSAAPVSMTTLRSIRTLRDSLRADHYDVVVELQGTLRSAVIGSMVGAKVFAGYADPRERAAGWLYGKKFARTGRHVVEQSAALLAAACGVKVTAAKEMELPREAWAESWAEAEAVRSRPLCVLAPGGGWGAKQWPAERFGELAKQVRGMGYDVAVNAVREDDVIAASVVKASGGAARKVVCNVGGLVALLRRTDVFVGGDSGPTHLAAALGVPLVALFGPTDPARNGPWGPGAMQVLRDAAAVTSYKKSATPDAGLARMSVETVVEAVRQVVLG